MSDLTIHTTVNIPASASEAWQVFGEDFANWASWAPGIETSKLEGPLEEGAIRVNETASLGTVKQHLARFDRDQRALAYEMREALPPFFTLTRNDWVIEELDDGHCRLVGEARFVLAEQAAPMRDKLQGKMGMVLEVFAQAFAERMA